jgi:membrane fusion protein (multidrug efflux system)
VTQGALVTANQPTALATIQQLDPIYVDVNQSSCDFLRLKREMEEGRLQQVGAGAAKVKLILEDGSLYEHEGTLQFSDVNVDPTTSAITLRAVFPNPNGLLLPGTFVRANIKEGVNQNAVLIPQQGVMRDPKGGAYVYVIGAQNKVEMRQIQTGQAVGAQWMILSGLKAGEQLIVEGIQKVKPGAEVKAVAPSNLTQQQMAEGGTPAVKPVKSVAGQAGTTSNKSGQQR